MWWPAIKKLVKNSKGRDVPPPDMPDMQNAVPMPEQNFNFPWPEPAEIEYHQPPKKKKRNTKKNRKPEQDIAPVPKPLHEEGISAVSHKPMAPVVDEQRATGARRELRRALVIGEILRPKF